MPDLGAKNRLLKSTERWLNWVFTEFAELNIAQPSSHTMPKHSPFASHIHARVDNGTKLHLTQQAKRLNISVSDYVREIIEQDKLEKDRELKVSRETPNE